MTEACEEFALPPALLQLAKKLPNLSLETVFAIFVPFIYSSFCRAGYI